MESIRIYRVLSIILLLLLIINQSIVLSSMNYNGFIDKEQSVESSVSSRFYSYRGWVEAIHDTDLRNTLFNEVIPPSGKQHDPYVEALFWTRVVPEKWFNGFYEEYLFGTLIPLNTSNGYYYYTLFHDILNLGFKKYYLEEDIPAFTSYRVFRYYYVRVFKQLVMNKEYDGFYYNLTFYKLYYDNIWGYSRILAYIAYYDDPTGFYALELTRIDLEKQLSNLTGVEPSSNILDTGGSGTIVFQIYTPDGPLVDMPLYIYTYGFCGVTYCVGRYMGTVYTNSSGIAIAHLPPGSYMARLGGLAVGLLTNIYVGYNETVTINEMLGKITINFYDKNNQPMPGLGFTIYEQILSPDSEPEPGQMVAYGVADSLGRFTRYVVAGTYILQLEIPISNPYIPDIVVVSGETRSYNYVVDAVPLTIEVLTPPTNTHYQLYISVHRELGTYNSVIDVWIDSEEASKTIYLEPGHYYLVLNSLYVNWSYLDIFNISEVDVLQGRSNVYVYRLGIVVWRPSNFVDKPGSSLGVEVYKAVSNGTNIWSTYRVGSLNLRYNCQVPLFPGYYIFKPMVGGKVLKEITVSVPQFDYTYITDYIPVGFLNFSTIFNNTRVDMYYSIYVDGDSPQYYGSGSSMELVALPPGTYTVILSNAGLNNTFTGIIVEENLTTNYEVRVGKLIVNLYSFNGTRLMSSVPVYVAPYVDGEVITDYQYMASAWTTGYYEFYLLPGTYAVIIPGTNVTYVYSWYYVGYGLYEINITLDEDHISNISFNLGRIVVNVTVPETSMMLPDFISGLSIHIATQDIVNGTPVIGREIYSDSIWHSGKYYFELTPGTYVVYLGGWYESILNNTIRYNVVVEPNGLATVNYDFKIITLNLTLSDGSPARYMELYITIGSQTLYIGRTDYHGYLSFLMCEGVYNITYQSYDQVYIATINITDEAYQLFNIVVPSGYLKIYALGPNNEPVPNMYFTIYTIDGMYVDYICTDANGTIGVALPPNTYKVYSDIDPGGKYVVNVTITSGEVSTITYRFALIKAIFNTNLTRIYLDLILVDRDTSQYTYIYEYLYGEWKTYIYVPPGNYSLVLPGIDTYPSGSYGYGESIDIVLPDYTSIVTVTFNLTYIVFRLNITEKLDRDLMVDLLTSGEEGYNRYITSGYMSSYSNVYAVEFIVTPGNYTVEIPSYWYSLGSPVRYDNLTVTIEEPVIITYTPGMLIVGIESIVETDTSYSVVVYVWTGSYWSQVTSRSLKPGEHTYFYLSSGYYKVTYGSLFKYITITEGEIKYVELSVTGIYVYLRGPENEPIINAEILLYTDTGSYVDSKYTDQSGKTMFIVDPGDYKVVLRGLNYYYDKYKVSIYENKTFGYGGEYPVSYDGSTPAYVNITLARIDLQVLSMEGPASGVQASLYSSNLADPLKGGLTGENGYVRFYVTPGNYTVVIRGLNYGWYDYYYLGLEYNKANGYGDFIIVDAPGIDVYSYTYKIGELKIKASLMNGIPLSNEYIGVYDVGYGTTIHQTFTDENGSATIYLTNGTYYVEVAGYRKKVFISSTNITEVNFTLAKIIVKLNIPDENILSIKPNLIWNREIRVYKNFTGPSTGTYIASYYTNSSGIVEFTLLAYQTYQIVLPGVNTTYGYDNYGYGDYVSIYLDSDMYIEFNLSVIAVYITGPYGGVSDVGVSLYTLEPSDYIGFSSADQGYVFFLVTPGRYKASLSSILGVEPFIVDIDYNEVVWWNVSLSVIIIKHNHSPEEYTGISIYVEDAVSHIYTSYYVEDSVIVYVGSGTYYVYNSNYYGKVYNHTITTSGGEEYVVEFMTRNIYFYLYKTDGTLYSEGFDASLYVQKEGEQGLDEYVRYSSSTEGKISFLTITPGTYVIKLPIYLHSIGHTVYLYDNELVDSDITVNYTLGGIVVKIIQNDGTPVSNHSVAVYTSSESGGIIRKINEGYTDENGTYIFYVTQGWYALYIDELGYVYGIYVESGEYTYRTYTLSPADLAITGVSWTPTLPGDGDTILVSINITNYGPGHVLSPFLVEFYLNDTMVYSTEVPGLLAGYNATIVAPITAIAGVDEIRIVIDPYMNIYDSNRSNNELIIYINVLKPDLAIAIVTFSPDMVDGGEAEAYINITNYGPSGIHRRFYVDVYFDGEKIKTFAIDQLEVNDTITLTVRFKVTGGYHTFKVVIDPANEVCEENEMNNQAVYVIHVPEPDLDIIYMSLDTPEMVDGAIAVLNVTIMNKGAPTLQSFFIHLYIDGEKYAVNYRYNGLGSNESFTTQFYVLLKGGSHNITVVVDPDHRIGDLDFTNNVKTLLINIPAPDLTIIDIEHEPLYPGDGETTMFNITIQNIGIGKTIANFYVSLYIDGVEKASALVTEDLDPGEQTYVVLYARLSAGNRTVTVIVDPEYRVGDQYRGNNILNITVYVLQSDLELVDLWINASTTEYYNLLTGELWFTIRNNGPGNINKTFYVAVFDNDDFIGQIPVNGLESGGLLNLSIDITFYTGNHIYTVIVDDHYQKYFGGVYIYSHTYEVSDPDRSNNNGSLTVYVKGPDLIVTNIYVEPEPPTPYASYEVNVTIGNIGDYDLTTSIWGVLHIGSKTILFEIPPLSIGEYVNVSVKHLPGLEPGSHIISVELNPYMEVYEHSYDNNYYNYTLNIPYPDLVVGEVTVYSPAVVDYLYEYNVTVVIRNIGWEFNHDFYVSLYRVSGSSRSCIGTYYVDHGLGSGENITITMYILAIPPGGELEVYVDSRNDVLEENETNNKVIVSGPLVRAISLYRTTYDFLYQYSENDTLRIDNVGDVPITITNITISSPYITIEESLLPIIIEPGSYVNIPFHVETVELGIGVHIVTATIYTNTTLSISENLTLVIYNVSELVNVMASINDNRFSYGGSGYLTVKVTYSYTIQPSEVSILLNGNGTVFFDSTIYNMTPIEYTKIIPFDILESMGEPGRYVLTVQITLTRYNLTYTKQFYFTVYHEPLLTIISPRGNNTVLASTTLVLTWRTNVITNATIYFRSIHDTTWTIIRIEKFKYYHSVNLGGLVNGETYMFYIEAYSYVGEKTVTDIYLFNVTTSVIFVEHEINVTIDRDYNQIIYIDIENMDPSFTHSVYAKIINSDPEIILDFIGPGSTDGVLDIGPRSRASVMLAIHAQDAIKLNYTVTALLVDLETNATDYMIIHIYVREPVFDVEVRYLGMDNYTLIQTYQLINHGDTITDLKVYLTGPISSFAYIYPSMNHVYLRAGQTITFYVIPILAKYPDDPSLLNGSIVVETGDPQKIEFELVKPELPEDYEIYAVVVDHMVARAQANDWYCTNRPYVETTLKFSLDPEGGEGDVPVNATLMVFFSPKYSRWDVRPHDGTIYVNGVPVYSWHDTIPEGYIVARIPPEAIDFNPTGEVSEIKITISTQHMNGGHYVVATSFTVIVETHGGKFYIAAPDYDTAREKLYTTFKPNMESAEPKECDKDVSMPTWLSQFLDKLPDKAKYDFEDLSIPSLIQRFTGGQIEPSASVSFTKDISPSKVSVSITGEFELWVGTYGIEGSVYGQASWGVQNCRWTFIGGELGASLQGGYRLKAEVPVSWLSWVTNDPVEFEVKVTIGVTQSKILLDERLHVKSVVNLLLGITVTGKATINLGSRVGLEASATISGSVGWLDSRFTGKFTVEISGDIKVNAGWFELSKSGSYSTGFKYDNRWRLLKPGEDPKLLVFRYKFYSEQLEYNYILLAENYSSFSSNIAYSEDYGTFTSWIASDNNNSYVMVSKMIGSTWASPETLPFPSDEWYVSTYALGFNDKPGVIVLKMPKLNLSTATYNDLIKAMNNLSILYTEYVNGSWVSPLTLVEEGVSLAFDAESNGLTAVAAWVENTSSEYAVYAMIYNGGSWSTPVMIVGSGTGSLEYKIRDISVAYMSDKPVVYWIVDTYRNVSGDTGELVTIIKYSVFSSGSWSEPVEVTGSWNAMYLSASGDKPVVAWSRSDQKIYLSIYNGSVWNNYMLGDGEKPYLKHYGEIALILASTYGVQKDLLLYSMNTSSLTYSMTQLTNDDIEDNYYSLIGLPSMGKAVVVWSRRPVTTEELGENETWAYGLYYLELGTLSIKNISVKPIVTVEGSTISIEINVSSTTNSTATLIVKVNGSTIYNETLNITANVTETITLNYTVHDPGTYVFEITLTNITPPTLIPIPTYTVTVTATQLLNITEPKPYSFVDEIFMVKGRVEGENPANITIYINGSIVKELYNVIGDFNTTINASSYPDSPLNLTIYAVTVGSEANDTYTAIIYLDKTPPTLIVIEPLNNTYVRGVVNVTVEAYDTYYELPRPPTIYVNGTAYNMTLLKNNLYRYLLNTTMYVDGKVLNLTITVRDSSGKYSCATIYVIPDNTPPITTHNSTKTWYNSNVTIMLTATDNVSGVNTTYYRVDYSNWTIGTVVYIPAPLDHSNDGLHIIEFYSIDNAGNIEEIKNLTIGIDTVSPQITCTLANNTYFAGGTIDIYYHIYDGTSGIKYYRLYLDGSLYRSETLNGASNATIDLRGMLLNYMYEGMHVIKVVVEDMAGNVEVYITVFYVDKTPPTVEIISPSDGSLVSGVINITFNYTDNLSPVEAILKINGEEINVTGTYSYLLNTTEYPDGALTITLTATDKAGRSSSTSITIYVDNTPPIIEIISPENNTYVAGNLTIIFNIDEDHLDQAWLYIDSYSFDVTGKNSFVFDTTVLSDGTYNIILYANDTLGHESSYQITIYVDNTKPVAIITYPLNNTYVSREVNIEFNYSDANLEKAILYINNGYVEVTGLYNYTLDTTQLTDGIHTIVLEVIDKAGNTVEYKIVIYVDNTLPKAFILEPVEGDLVAGNLTIIFNYSDVNFESAWLIIGDQVINVTGIYNYTINTMEYPDGELTITLRVYDKAGNIGEVNVTVTIDNTAPIINVIAPYGYVSGTVTIEWSIIEPHLNETILIINGEEIIVTGMTSYEWDTTLLLDGTYTLTLKATDMLGHITIVSWEVVIDNTPPTIVFITPSNNTLVADMVEIMFNYTDNYEVSQALIYIDGNLYMNVTGANTLSLDTTTLSDGVHSIELMVMDRAGNVGSSTLLINIDNTAPIVEILYPANNTTFIQGETITINWSIIEPNLLNATLYIDESAINVTTLNNYTLDTTQLIIGSHVIKLVVIDKLGHISETMITINIEAPPTTTPTTTPTSTPTPTTTTPPLPTTRTPTTSPTTPTPGIPGTLIATIIIVIIIAVAAIFFLKKK